MLLWERFPALYRLYRTNPLSGQFLNAELSGLSQLLAAYPPPPGRILDIGTGTGFSLTPLPASGSLTAIDICLPLLTGARTRYPSATYLQADTRNLPFKNAAFSLISIVGVTDYMQDKAHLLETLYNLLIPNGRLLITFAPRSPLNAVRRLLGHRLHLCNKTEIKSLIQNSPFSITGRNCTRLQSQYLLTKES